MDTMPTDSVKPYYINIGDKISNFRNRLGLTQKELAIKVNVSRATLANIEAGKQNVHVHILHRIADALGAEISELIPSQLYFDNKKIIGAEINDIKALEKGTQNILKDFIAKVKDNDKNNK